MFFYAIAINQHQASPPPTVEAHNKWYVLHTSLRPAWKTPVLVASKVTPASMTLWRRRAAIGGVAEFGRYTRKERGVRFSALALSRTKGGKEGCHHNYQYRTIRRFRKDLVERKPSENITYCEGVTY